MDNHKEVFMPKDHDLDHFSVLGHPKPTTVTDFFYSYKFNFLNYMYCHLCNSSIKSLSTEYYIFPWIFPSFQKKLKELPEKKCVHIQKGETSRYSIYHFLMNGFWQTSSRWSLPFWRSITLASHRICVVRVRAISMAPTLSERTAHPWKPITILYNRLWTSSI